LKSTITTIIVILLGLVFTTVFATDNTKISSFSTNGTPVYHIKTGMLQPDKRAVITASINGVVQCFTPNGKPIWKAETGGGFPFDLCVADIDKDGMDEVFVASGNGTLYAFDNNGKVLWKFVRVAPLFQVSVAGNDQGEALVITGGVEQVLYALSPKGEIVNEIKTDACIRHIRTGRISGTNKDEIALVTASSGLFANLSLMLIDTEKLEIKWKKSKLGRYVNNSGQRFFSLLIKDINKDNRQEILLSGAWGENGSVYAFDSKGENLFTKSDKQIPNIAYRMNLLRSVNLPDDDFYIGHFGHVLIVYNLDGTCREVLTGKYSYADSYFDQSLKTLFMGSSVSGGDEIMAFRLDQKGWQEKFRNVQSIGQLAEIESNIKILNKQINI